MTAPNAFFFYLGASLLMALGVEWSVPQERANTVRAGEVITAAVGCTAALFLLLTAFRIGSTDLALGTAERRIEAGDAKGASEAYRQAFERRKSGVQADLFFARRWARAAAATSDVIARVYLSQLASGAANLATEDAEGRHNAWYNVAELAASRDDPASAARALQSAIQASPNWFKPHWALARLLFLVGRGADALPEAQRAVELDGGKDPEVAATMDQILRSTQARR
jgi:tetratricopeptide (TPR) repeat protein